MKSRALLSLLFGLTVAAATYAADKPNVVLVLVDDLGWADLSCQGSTFYRTPAIDKLASEGVRFTQGYAACAVCSPTRAAVQTGRYPHATGVTDWIRSLFQGGRIPLDGKNPCWAPQSKWKGKNFLCPPNALWMEHREVTIAEMLKGAGYATCYIGKWHLGATDWYPQAQGYDENFGGCDYGQPPNYFDPYTQPKGRHQSLRDGIPGLPGRKPGEYLSDREGDEAVGFIQRNAGNPFFLMLAHYAVHTPIQAKADVAATYEGQSHGKQKNAKYAAMVQSVDDAMGKVIATLEAEGIRDNTLILFTSDNGGLVGPTDNAPLRSGKGHPYEGGIRVPFIVQGPGVTQKGTVREEPVISMDLLPTIAAATGVDLPKGVELHGENLMPLLNSTASIERDTLYWHFPHYRHNPGPYSIIRDGDWKLIMWYEGPRALFNLADDPGEATNLAEKNPTKLAALEKKLMAHLHATTDRIPVAKK